MLQGVGLRAFAIRGGEWASEADRTGYADL